MKYLIIEWVNDSPIISGALYYDDMKTASRMCEFLEALAAKTSLSGCVKYTICQIEPGGFQLEKKADTGILTINVKTSDFNKVEVLNLFKGSLDASRPQWYDGLLETWERVVNASKK